MQGLFFSGDVQAGAGDRFAVLVVQVGRYGLDGLTVKSGAGEIGQADFVAAYFQIVGGTLSQCLTDLDLQLLLFSCAASISWAPPCTARQGSVKR